MHDIELIDFSSAAPYPASRSFVACFVSAMYGIERIDFSWAAP